MREKLYEKFDDVLMRPGRGGTYPFVKAKKIFDRMNECFDVNWSSEVISEKISDNEIVIRARVTIRDPQSGKMYWQDGYGGAQVGGEAGNAFKSAYSKAMKDACKKWGVGLYLEDDDEPATTEVPTGYMGKETAPMKDSIHLDALPAVDKKMSGLPKTTTQTPMPSVKESKVAQIPTAPPVERTNTPLPSSETVAISEPAKSSMTQAAGGMPIPPGAGMITPPGGSMLARPKTNMAPPAGMEMPAPKSMTIDTGVTDTISDVQKAALNSILSIKGVEYEVLAREAFDFNGVEKDIIPPPEQLTYQEAVYVVKYGNDKFRKR